MKTVRAYSLPLLTLTTLAALAAPIQPAANPALAAAYGNLPLSFEANQGQVNARVNFLAHGNGYSLFLTDAGATLSLERETANSHLRSATPTQPDVVRMELSGARHARVSGDEMLPGKANYFIGSESSRWHTNLPTYARVRYTGVYPGVDLVYYGKQGVLEYDFVVAPHADLRPIRMQFAGAKKLSLTPDGDLTVVASNGEIAFHKPVVYQIKDGQRKAVAGSFKLLADDAIGFEVGRYDSTRALILDPTLAYSTYLGGNVADYATGIAVDSTGHTYIAGVATSSDFPVSGTAYQKTLTGYRSAFITKLNATGSAIVYSTYLGGSAGDAAAAIAINSNGDAFITGYSTSSDFPTTSGAYQRTNKNQGYGNNAFLAKIGTSGSTLIYSTLIGGSGIYNVDTGVQDGDQATAVALDSKGNAYIAGSTFSTDFPISTGAYQKNNTAGPNDSSTGFITKFNVSGSALVYSTFIGGSEQTAAAGIAVDASGEAYVVGTTSYNFPTTNGAFQSTPPTDYPTAFVTKLNAAGSALAYSTYLGGSASEVGNAIAINSAGNAFVTGATSSSNFPVTGNAVQTKIGFANDEDGGLFVGNAFVSELNPTGSALVYSTYLGGSMFYSGDSTNGDVGFGIALDSAGYIDVAGAAYSSNFPHTAYALQKTNANASMGGSSGFLARLKTTSTTLDYSTYIGGSEAFMGGSDGLSCIAADGSGNLYVAGQSSSTKYPVTSSAFQKTNAAAATSGSNAVVSKFSF